MKKHTLLTVVFFALIGNIAAQNSYWVVFSDKNKDNFNPYEYFDSKAIERYQLCGADLYDITNYPVNATYANTVEAMSQELVGTSRWLNAAGIVANESQIEAIRLLPFVKDVYLIETGSTLAEESSPASVEEIVTNVDQVDLHNGGLFKKKNITGKGVRIAIFDGGFKEADTHPAFKHLFDNKKIVKTWNFVNKNENVYLGSQHGRMVLSCIAGVMDDTTYLGMAPDAEFLLARTEINPEKKKEEIWWVAALEWADQNGADIVNSSLGYGKQRYDLKDMDGKTSIVAKAANTAARKGILICNSMGNEGDDWEWMMLITPADADSILSVGAVSSIDHLSYFSSFGPTADGRMKPNVVAKGHCQVAGSKGNFVYADGTSFSSPMVAGFAACVKQVHPEYTAIQLKEEIEKSGNHYPYFDYAFGYGVPQADYFFDNTKQNEQSIIIKEDSNKVYVVPANSKDDKTRSIFYKIVNGDNTIEEYNVIRQDKNYETGEIVPYFFYKGSLLKNQRIEMWCDGQYIVYEPKENGNFVNDTLLADAATSIGMGDVITLPEKDIFTRPFKKTHTTSLVLNASFILPTMWARVGNVWSSERMSRTFTFAIDNNWRIAKPYGLGLRVGFGSSWYAVSGHLCPESYVGDGLVGELVKSNIKITKFDLEFYQRFFLGRAGSKHWFLDTGFFGEWNVGRRYKCVTKEDVIKTTFVQRKYLPYDIRIRKFDCGVRLRIGITKWAAIYGQYRITSLIKPYQGKNMSDLPKWEVGVQIF